MRNIDLSPLYRSMIGLDHMASLIDSASRSNQAQSSYPPYNIEQLDEDNYQITMAVAGFEENELAITSENNTIFVEGKKVADKSERKFLHQGLASRNFKHSFQLAEHIKIQQADLRHGILYIDLLREIPEEMKPRNIPIGNIHNVQGSLSDKATKIKAA